MSKKILVILLVMGLCLSSISAMASKGNVAAQDETTQQEVTADTDEDAIEDADEDQEDIDAVEDTDTDTKEDAAKTDTKKEDKQDKEKVDKEKKDKAKVSKDELKAKKQERAEARIEAKVYIKEIKKLFKDADPATKKEILAEIAALKKELKDLSIGIFVRGLNVDFEKYDNVEPVVENNRTLIPLRAIIESLGADVKWTDETKTITITKDDKVITMQIDNVKATVDGEEVELEVAPTIRKNRTLVPIRFISETFDLNVAWDDESKTIVVE